MLNEILNALKVHKIENISDVGINIGINDGINVGINERNILAIIANSPNATVRDMADALGLSLRQCERLIAEMKRKNLIKRTGSNKSGFWEII